MTESISGNDLPEKMSKSPRSQASSTCMSYASYFPLAHAPGSVDPMIGSMEDAAHGAAFRDRPTFKNAATNLRSSSYGGQANHHRTRAQRLGEHGRFTAAHNHTTGEIMEIVDHDFILQ